jgi:predicted nucleotidyltransferase
MRPQAKLKNKEIERYAQEVAKKFHPEKIILFGSHAYGTPDIDSDVDILILMDFEGRPVDQAVAIDSQIKRNFPLDLIVRRVRDFNRRVKLGDFFLREIVEKGTTLYERPGS